MAFEGEVAEYEGSEDNLELQVQLTLDFVELLREHLGQGSTTAKTVARELNWTVKQSKPWGAWIRKTPYETIAKECGLIPSEANLIQKMVLADSVNQDS